MRPLPFDPIDPLHPVRVSDLNRVFEAARQGASLLGPGVVTVAGAGYAGVPPERFGLVLATLKARSDDPPYRYSWAPNRVDSSYRPVDQEAGNLGGYQTAAGDWVTPAVDPRDPDGNHPWAVGDVVHLQWDEGSRTWHIVGGAEPDCLLVVLTDKTNQEDAPFIRYTAYRVTDTDSPTGSGSGSAGSSGSGGGEMAGYDLGEMLDLPVYHAQNVDLPVWLELEQFLGSGSAGSGSGGSGSSGLLTVPEECVVRACKGAGPWYLIDDQPRVEVVRKRTPAESASVNGVTYQVGDLMRYDQTDKALVVVKTAYILDLTNL